MITKEQCDQIVAANPAFYRIDTVVDGVNVFIYNYRLASITDFKDALRDSSNLQAFELRGITFVEQSDGSFERFLALSKFFNYGETTGWMPEHLDPSELISIHEKLDGSMIHFVRINNRWHAKTKQSFVSVQAQAAQVILDSHEGLQGFLDSCYNDGVYHVYPIFEYTAPDNQIVLYYSKQELRLIQIRDQKGKYLSCNTSSILNEFNVDSSRVLNSFRLTSGDVKRLIHHQRTNVTEEGYVANIGGKLVKFKTDWYFLQHRAKDMLGRSSKTLLELVLANGFDDAIAMVEDRLFKQDLEAKADKIRQYFNTSSAEISALLTEFPTHPTRKDFCILHNKHKYFGCVMAVVDGKKDLETALTEAMLRRYNTSELVDKLLEEW